MNHSAHLARFEVLSIPAELLEGRAARFAGRLPVVIDPALSFLLVVRATWSSTTALLWWGSSLLSMTPGLLTRPVIHRGELLEASRDVPGVG